MTDVRFQRYELKFFVTEAQIRAIRALVAPFMGPDPHAGSGDHGGYTVRSIYFDTPDLRFYHEKEAGQAVRKKLRLRTYGDLPADPRAPGGVAFFEIKRKRGFTILKERVGLSFDCATGLCAEDPAHRMDFPALRSLELSRAARATLERFFFLEQSLRLRPSVLVVYDREAYVGVENPRIRLTFDRDVRSIIRPELDEIFAQKGLRRLTDEQQVLELKFDGSMPAWLRPVTTMLDRFNGPISKYCRAIDLWSPADEAVAGLTES